MVRRPILLLAGLSSAAPAVHTSLYRFLTDAGLPVEDEDDAEDAMVALSLRGGWMTVKG